MQPDFPTWFRNIRNRRVPLVAIVSPDMLASEQAIVAYMQERERDKQVILWDCIRGFRNTGEWENAYTPELALAACEQARNQAVVIMHGLDMWLVQENQQEIVQGIVNLRGVFEQRACTLVMVGSSVHLPGNLAQDVVVYEEAFPGDGQYAELMTQACKAAKPEAVPVPVERQMQQACDALRGLSMFAARQQVGLSLKRAGLDTQALWQHKKKMIDATPGLTVFLENPGFNDWGGSAQYKEEAGLIFQSRRVPKAIVQIDEGEKSLAASETDSSGVSQDYLQVLLTHFQDTRAQGMINYGVSGTGKTFACQAIAGEFHVPLIRLDINACKNMLVGQSEANLRRAIRIIEAIAGGEALWVLTCNRVDTLKPEFKARLNPIWFFDKPDEQEQLSIWSIHRRKYEIATGDALPSARDVWVGREIEQCCRRAWQFGVSLQEAARRIVPVMVQGRDVIEQLRKDAHGKYLSPSYAGVYRYHATQHERSVQLEE